MFEISRICMGMLDVNQIAAIAIKDYYNRMARVSKDRSYWYGLGSISLGYRMHDPVDANDLYALCALGKKAATAISQGGDLAVAISAFEAHQAELERPRRSGYDLTVKADKSAGLAFLGHPDEKTRDATLLSHQLSVNAMLRFLEQKAGFSRVTENGEVSIIKAEMVEAVFTHFTNRNLEPQLHSHIIVPNVVRCEDGQWRALHNDELYSWYMAAGAVYRSAFREHMRRLTTANFVIKDGWKSQIQGLSEWKGPDGASLLDAYSQRHREVVEEMERRMAESPTGTISPKLKKKLGVMTRKEKDFGDGDARIDEIAAELRETLAEVWRLGENEWREIMTLRPEPLADDPIDGLWLEIPKHLAVYGAIPTVQDVNALADYMSRIFFDEGGGGAKEGVLSGRAYVSVQDIHTTAHNLFGGFVSGEVFDEAISGLLAGGGQDAKLKLKPLAAAVYVKGQEAPLSRVPIRFYATAGVLNSEARVLQLADRKTTSAILDEEVVNKYLAETIKEQRAKGGFILSEEQQHALRHLFSSDTSATLLMGAQGAGKTTMFSHFAKLARANDIVVWGLAPTGTAAQKLGNTLRTVDADAQSMTIESFTGKILSGRLLPPENLCLILDESSQADTLELAETLELVTSCGAKLILVGDDRQLGSVRYGGMFATLFAKLGGARLTETRRAADAWDRTAQAHLRMGDLREALRIYDQAGRLSVADDQLSLVESVRGWLDKEFKSGTDAFVITNTKCEEIMANQLARAAWGKYRAGWMRDYLDSQVRHHRMSSDASALRLSKVQDNAQLALGGSEGELVLRLGDLVAVRQSLKTDKGAWLGNGQRWRVVDLTDKWVTLYLEDESSTRHVRLPVSTLRERPGAISHGWASTVYRTQSMELGSQERTLNIADELAGLIPDTPVEVRKTARRSKSFTAEFLEYKTSKNSKGAKGAKDSKDSKGAKVSVRLANGKVRTVASSRVFLAEETQDRIENMITEALDGNALVLGTEGMSLDALLVSASRARQRTDFLFRSVKATESDYMSEKLLADAGPEELARATMALYVARQSRPEQPDSAYLRLAREREATTLAASVDLDLLGALRLWLADNLTSGSLDISADRDRAVADRNSVMERLSNIESELALTGDPERQAHLLAEVEACQFRIDYAGRELARLEVFSDFIGHAEGALSDKSGQVVIDERYIKDRISLVDEAIVMAEDRDSWIDISEAIVVPLPENTAREVVDVSAKDEVELDRRAKLFSSVSYRVASDWMVLADGLYDKALAENLSPEEAMAGVELSESDRARLREAFSAVAVNRMHPTPVGHPVTLRTLREEALTDEVDPELLAAVERITESISDQEVRRAERRSEDRRFEEFEDDEEEPMIYESDPGSEEIYFVPGEAEPALEDGRYEADFDDPDDHHVDRRQARSADAGTVSSEAAASPTRESAEDVEPATEERGQERHYSAGFFYRGEDGVWHADMDRRDGLYNQALRKGRNLPDRSGPLAVHKRREVRQGSGQWYDPVLDENNEAFTPELTKELRDEQFDTEGREYHGGFFYRNADGAWCVDFRERAKLERAALERRRDCLRDGRWSYEDDEDMTKRLDVSRARRVSLSENDPLEYRRAIYDPARDPYASALRAAEKRWEADAEAESERLLHTDTRRAYGAGEREVGYGSSKGTGQGYKL